MDNILDDNSSVDVGAVQLDDLIETRPLTTAVTPVPSVRNRAAIDAILSGDPENLVGNYQLYFQEGMEGNDSSHQQVMNRVAMQNNTQGMRGLIELLGDPNIPITEKQKYLNFVQTNGFKEEPAVTIQTAALAKESEGEDFRGEEARISITDTMYKVNKEAQDRQRMVNTLVAETPDQSIPGMVGEIAATDVMPLGRNYMTAKLGNSLRKAEGKSSWIADIKDFLLPGSAKRSIQDRLASIPVEQREEFTAKVIQGIKESASIFPSENYYARYQMAVQLLDSPAMSTKEVWTENITTLLDLFWITHEAKALRGSGKTTTTNTNPAGSNGPKGGGSAAEDVVHKADRELVDDPTNPMQIGKPKDRIGMDKAADVEERLRLNSVVRRENPVTPYHIIEQVNPAQARAIHKSIVTGGDEYARAMTGVSREEAIINNIAPQVGTDSGAVSYKVNQAVKDELINTGGTRYAPEEFESGVQTLKHDFRSASGMEINDAMTTFREHGDAVIIEAHYSPAGGSWTTPDVAMEQAKFALRKYGIRDDEITLMKRDGMDYVPANGATEPGDYMVKVTTRQPITDEMITQWTPFTTKRNWVDRIGVTGTEKHGSIAGNIMDPGSMLDPRITSSASVAKDRAVVMQNILLEQVKDFRNTVEKFPLERRAALNEYFIEANEKGLKFSDVSLKARGFSDAEIAAAKKWREYWDTQHYLENHDFGRIMKSQGWQLFQDSFGSQYIAKPVQKNQNIVKAYDPSTNSIRVIDKGWMDSLYNQNGTLAQFRKPINIHGADVEHIIVRNTPNEYLRGIRDTDNLLNYRDGYFTVNYKRGSKFVDEIERDANGNIIKRTTVAVGGNTKDAETFAKSQGQVTGKEYMVREDIKGMTLDSDAYFDVNHAAGRIAQRTRGKPLVEASGVNNLGTGAHIENPMESAMRSARSVAGLHLMRPALETAKRRFVQQFGDLIHHTDQFGQKTFPTRRDQLADIEKSTSKRIADARTTYTYIRQLEGGFVNAADEVYKAGMQYMADIFGKMGASKAEQIAQGASTLKINQAAKGTVFHAYLAGSHPIRQWIVQGHQATRMAAYNPIGFANGEMVKRMVAYLGDYSQLLPAQGKYKDFIKFVEDSGMVAGVDTNSLVRGLGLSMADSSSKGLRAAGKVASLPQLIGFDVGEKFNMLGHLAAVHEKYLREGKNLLNPTIRDAAYAEARALSYDLNAAGELHYTTSSVAMIVQFLQIPHKAAIQIFNRKVPFEARARLAVWDLVMFGAPVGLIGGLVTAAGGDGKDILPDDPDQRDAIKYGLTTLYLNKMFSMMEGDGANTRLDYSALAPVDLDGWARVAGAFWDGGPFAALAASPAAQLLAINGVGQAQSDGRITKALLTVGRFFNVFDEIDPDNPTKFTNVLNDVAKISSFWSATSRGLIALETRKKMDKMGRTLEDELSNGAIAGLFLGFDQMSVKELYEVTHDVQQTIKDHEADVLKRYRDIVQYVTESLEVDNRDVEHTLRVSSMLMRSFNNPKDMEIVRKQWLKDMHGPHAKTLRLILEASGIPNVKLLDYIRMTPMEEWKKAGLQERYNDMKKLNSMNEGQK